MITLSHDSITKSVRRNPRVNPAIEHYHALRNRLRAAGEATGTALKTVGVTSCAAGEGASTVAANLAASAAATADSPVLLVDLNIASPSQATIFGATGQRGLSEALSRNVPFGQCARPTSIENLLLLAPSAADTKQAMSCERGALRDLLQGAQHDFDLIVVDLPPVSESGPCLEVSGLLSGVLLVIEAERTRYEVASRAVQRLLQAHASVLGVVLNKRPQHIPEWLYKRI
jgi:capsular exopolysaccharide synthesis family protein